MRIIQKDSPNHYEGRNGWKADIIVFHQTGGDTLTPALNWYLNKSSQCAPHFVIDKDGTVYQLISLDNASYANGTRTTPGDKLYFGYSLSDLVKTRKTNANYYTYSIEFVHCAQGNITEKQISAVAELIGTVIFPHMRKNGVIPKADREHFIGHSHISPKTRDPEKFNCPGKQFPYDTIISRVTGKTVSAIPQAQSQTKPTSTLTKKSVKLAYTAVIRDTPSMNGKRLGTLYPGEITTVLVGSETKDQVSSYVYIKVDDKNDKWIVRSAIAW